MGRKNGRTTRGTSARSRTCIPRALLEANRWTTWRLVKNHGGKPTKRPTGSTLDPRNRLPFASVADELVAADGGIGFTFTDGVDVDGARLLALDMDACRDPATGALTSWAEELLLKYGRSYTEVTPSGAGLRLYLLVRQPPRAMPIIRVPADAPIGVDKTPEVQVFGCGPAGYVTVTGDQLPGTEPEPVVVDTLGWLLNRYRVEEQDGVESALPVGKGAPPSVAEIRERVQMAPDGPALLAGHWQDLELPSASEAWWRLSRATLRAARNHGETAADFLLNETAYGAGLVDSRDPDRYARRGWVVRDLARIAAKAAERGGEVFADAFDLEGWTPPAPPPERGGAWLLQASDFAASCEEQRFLVYGLLPARGLAQLFGDPSCGKTPFAISLALHVALGEGWFGHDLERPGAVVYLIGEDPTGVRDRVVAQLDQIDPTLVLADVPLYLSTRPGRLIEPKNAQDWANQIREAVGDAVSLVVVDTQNRNFGPGNENATEDMTQFVESIDGLSRELGALVLLVHHTGHLAKNRARGASVLPAALDAAFEIRRDGYTVTAVPYKAKNWREPDPLVGSLVPVEIGVDAKGRPVTAITLDDRPPDPADVFEEDEEGEMDLRVIVEALGSADGVAMSQAEIMAATGLSRKVIRGRIARAIELEMVKTKKGRGRVKLAYVATAKGLMSWPSSEGQQGVDLLS